MKEITLHNTLSFHSHSYLRQSLNFVKKNTSHGTVVGDNKIVFCIVGLVGAAALAKVVEWIKKKLQLKFNPKVLLNVAGTATSYILFQDATSTKSGKWTKVIEISASSLIGIGLLGLNEVVNSGGIVYGFLKSWYAASSVAIGSLLLQEGSSQALTHLSTSRNLDSSNMLTIVDVIRLFSGAGLLSTSLGVFDIKHSYVPSVLMTSGIGAHYIMCSKDNIRSNFAPFFFGSLLLAGSIETTAQMNRTSFFGVIYDAAVWATEKLSTIAKALKIPELLAAIYNSRVFKGTVGGLLAVSGAGAVLDSSRRLAVYNNGPKHDALCSVIGSAGFLITLYGLGVLQSNSFVPPSSNSKATRLPFTNLLAAFAATSGKCAYSILSKEANLQRSIPLGGLALAIVTPALASSGASHLLSSDGYNPQWINKSIGFVSFTALALKFAQDAVLGKIPRNSRSFRSLDTVAKITGHAMLSLLFSTAAFRCVVDKKTYGEVLLEYAWEYAVVPACKSLYNVTKGIATFAYNNPLIGLAAAIGTTVYITKFHNASIFVKKAKKLNTK